MLVGHYIKLSEVINSGLGKIVESGADYPEINLNIPWREEHEKFLMDETSVFNNPPVIHAPEVEISSAFEEIRKSIIQVLSDAIKLTYRLGGEKIVIHPVISRFHELDIETEASLKKEAIENILRVGDEMDVKICLENTGESPELMNQIVRMVDGAMFCLDVGHANLMSDGNRSLRFIELLHDKLGNVHLSDNVGGHSYFWDLHLPIGAGNIDFEAIIGHLVKFYDETVTLEIFSEEFQGLSVDKIKKIIGRVKLKK